MGVLTVILIVCMVIPAALANIIVYPFSKKLSIIISDYIIKVLAPTLFSIMKTYRHFNFWGYEESKKDLPENFLVISNHQSLLDIPCYMRFFKEKEPRFVAKDQLARHVPLVSEMLRSQEHCCIPRKAKPMDAINYLGAFGRRVVERNQTPFLFPEGTRTKDGSVGKFYSAGFRKLTEESGLPVVVCALDGGWKLRDIKKIASNMKVGCYRVKVLKVYGSPKTKDECNTILEESKILITQQVEEWRKLPSGQKY